MTFPRGLAALLFTAIFLPALAIVWGAEDGQVVFVLYREPKLACLKILGWIFLAALWWREGHRLTPSRIVATLTHPVVAALGLFLLWSAATAAWVTVRRNLSYELGSLLLLFFWLVCLRAHPEAARWRRVVEDALVASAAVLTGIGILQAAGALPFLPAIDPQYGGHHASLMGYKNPMALALVGQLFLLAGRVAAASGFRRGLGSLLLAVEVGYLATLLSRTSYLAVGAGGLTLVGLHLLRRRTANERLVPVAPLAAILLVVSFIALIHPATRARLASAESLLASPGAYLETDRGVYLRNTLRMVEHRPWGVGLGDWQTHYPVYRRVDRYRAYDDQLQVRRAHSDHVQTLGETGWLGLLLWGGFWATVLAHAGRRAIAADAPPRRAFAAAQLAAFAAAMATDYVIEVPYLELQLFAVLFLSLTGCPGTAGSREEGEEDRGLRILAWPMILIAFSATVASSSALVKSHRAADVSHHYLRAIESEGTSSREHLEQAVEAGGTFARLPGHEKTFYRTWLVLADAWLRLGELDRAAIAAGQAFELHPFNPGTFRWLARLERDRGRVEEAAKWQGIYHQIMHQADSGPPETLRVLEADDIVQ